MMGGKVFFSMVVRKGFIKMIFAQGSELSEERRPSLKKGWRREFCKKEAASANALRWRPLAFLEEHPYGKAGTSEGRVGGKHASRFCRAWSLSDLWGGVLLRKNSLNYTCKTRYRTLKWSCEEAALSPSSFSFAVKQPPLVAAGVTERGRAVSYSTS